MSLEKLKIEVINLIDSKREGEYWDFKQKHHKNKDDLLHDIICMANNRADRDGYIIFGIEDATFEIIGVNQDENRKSQQQIIDFLKDKKFVSGIRPTIELKTLNIRNKEIDILIIKNTTDTPYYMVESFQKIRSNYIYTRVGDTNTPKDKSADINHVEYLWKKRFLLNRPLLQQIENKIQHKDEWKYEDRVYYNTYNPQFKICIVEDDEIYRLGNPEFYAYQMTDSSVRYEMLEIKYYETKLYSRQIVHLDGSRLIVPTPEWEFLSLGSYRSESDYTFKYFIKESLDFKILKFLLEEDNHEALSAYRRLCEVILIFDTVLEKDNFINYIRKNRTILAELIEKDESSYGWIDTNNDRERMIVEERLKTGFALNKMLEDFRNRICK
ncbi:ATP-binding protein [Paraclostridium sordellii]|uniref:ATP-binding protein n=1 Tax=Paraclostridium sordellii TaxID=1505 RepID=UPI0005E399F7|nr:ATP-binding protein [Paeniclostridium sordellii]CEP43608.1 putative transcriptional regulator with HTH domain [[Clostridium] sordellii] [Paeniclostridium sordellii]CEP50370.1 putative transcriptional regulator with HTH domain [[Clostridium] sordellii] [Paeniclostridium sordellii]